MEESCRKIGAVSSAKLPITRRQREIPAVDLISTAWTSTSNF
jgi:hypothetical protein